ncbi:MAG: hypothetical protein ACLQF4_18455, partial [Xanthobacteraceae bacterium]
MARKSDIYQDRLFKAQSQPDGWTQIVEVETSRREDFPDNTGGRTVSKLVAYFKGIKSGLV